MFRGTQVEKHWSRDLLVADLTLVLLLGNLLPGSAKVRSCLLDPSHHLLPSFLPFGLEDCESVNELLPNHGLQKHSFGGFDPEKNNNKKVPFDSIGKAGFT